MARRPDIILLVLDTQRADRLSCYGYERPTSPNLDLLSTDATRFAAAIAPAQWTVPTHASIFTGLYPSQHTAHQMNSSLPKTLPTLAQRLSAIGYSTVGFSQNPLIGLVKNDLDRGFDRFESYHLLSNILLTTRLNRPDSSSSTGKRLEHTLRWLVAESLGYSHESPLRFLAPLLSPVWQRFLEVRGRSKVAGTMKLLDEASRLLLERQKGAVRKPIFLFINLMGTHVPYEPDRRRLEQLLPVSHSARQVNRLLRWANRLQIDVHNWLDQPLPPQQRVLLNAIYDAEVATQDAQVGSFLQRLREGRRYEDTLIAIVGDHGDHLGDKSRVNHAFGVYQALIHVPLIIRDPENNLPRGQVRREPVSTRRLFHTLLTAAGAATAEEGALALDHVGEATGDRGFLASVYSEGFPLEWALGRLGAEKMQHATRLGHTEVVRAVRRDQYKLLKRDGRRELYDLAKDALEEEDLQTAAPQRIIDILQQDLRDFTSWARPVAGAETHQEDDPRVLQQLRNLGYLE